MRSLSEIETTAKRASRAAGYSWGIAEEIGKSIRLTELFGFPGIKHLNQYYQNKKKEKFNDIKLIKKSNKSNGFSFCPIILGVNFIDQVKNIETLKKCSVEKLAYPLLFLPFLSRGSEIIGKKLLFSLDDIEFLLNFNVSISSNYWKKEIPILANQVEISFLDNEDNFSDHDWKNLYNLAENTFVEETESLKEGAAGAGLTDND
tara:strand:+ start:2640 stop:3251 length:612 start_codon:yes stop_codon:yes gene_type:complete